MKNIFNKSFENKIIDNILVAFFMGFIFLAPPFFLYYCLSNEPIKEVFSCNNNSCILEQHFLFNDTHSMNMQKPYYIKVESSGAKLRTYRLVYSPYHSLFNSPYFNPLQASKARDLILSSSDRLKITKYNSQTFLVIALNLFIICIIIYGRINYLRKHKDGKADCAHQQKEN